MSTTAQRAAFKEGTRLLFEELAWKPGDVFKLRSKSRDELEYSMTVTPEGYVVHQDEGCEGEQFNGVGECWHSTESEKFVTQQLTVHQGTAVVPTRIEFDTKQLDTIAKVICVDSNGNAAPSAFVELFLAACRHSGLDPFLRQIYALKLQNKWTMYVGVDGYRVIADRTGLMEGMDGPQWSSDGETWLDFPFSDDPSFCRVQVWRKGVPRPFVAVCTMKAKRNASSKSWQDDAPGMLAKCTEILALRRAFPADMAVIPSDAVAYEDADGVPITKAEVPAGEWREVASAAPEKPSRTPATDEQRKAIAKVWNPKHPRIEELRQRFPRAFPQPGAGSNDTRVLSYDEASEVLAILSETPETVTLTAASLPNIEKVLTESDLKPGEYRDDKGDLHGCSHDGEQKYDEAGVRRCAICNAALEGPDSEPAQAALKV